MQGSIQISLTRRDDGNLLPAINAKYPKRQTLGQEDSRDELIESFVEELQHPKSPSNWARVEFNEPESNPYKFFRIIPIRGDELPALIEEIKERVEGKKIEYHHVFAVRQEVSVNRLLGGGNFSAVVLAVHSTENPATYDLSCRFYEKEPYTEPFILYRVAEHFIHGKE